VYHGLQAASAIAETIHILEIRMLSRRVGPFAVAASFILASGSAAQSAPPTDSLAFRSGQWGVFGTVIGSGSLGFMRFSTPHRAITLDANIGVNHSKQDQDQSSPFGAGSATSDQQFANLRFGIRRYRSLSRELTSFVGFGPSAFVARTARDFENSQGGSGSDTSTSWGAGLFFDGGVSAMVHRRLLLGAVAGVAASGQRSSSDGTSSLNNQENHSRSTQWSFIAGMLRLEATVLF
jgi:hypothetical protein